MASVAFVLGGTVHQKLEVTVLLEKSIAAFLKLFLLMISSFSLSPQYDSRKLRNISLTVSNWLKSYKLQQKIIE